MRLVAVDDRYAMRADALEAAVEADITAGLIPVVVVSAVGTTGTTAVDPVRAIGRSRGSTVSGITLMPHTRGLL